MKGVKIWERLILDSIFQIPDCVLLPGPSIMNSVCTDPLRMANVFQMDPYHWSTHLIERASSCSMSPAGALTGSLAGTQKR